MLCLPAFAGVRSALEAEKTCGIPAWLYVKPKISMMLGAEAPVRVFWPLFELEMEVVRVAICSQHPHLGLHFHCVSCLVLTSFAK